MVLGELEGLVTEGESNLVPPRVTHGSGFDVTCTAAGKATITFHSQGQSGITSPESAYSITVDLHIECIDVPGYEELTNNALGFSQDSLNWVTFEQNGIVHRINQIESVRLNVDDTVEIYSDFYAKDTLDDPDRELRDAKLEFTIGGPIRIDSSSARQSDSYTIDSFRFPGNQFVLWGFRSGILTCLSEGEGVYSSTLTGFIAKGETITQIVSGLVDCEEPPPATPTPTPTPTPTVQFGQSAPVTSLGTVSASSVFSGYSVGSGIDGDTTTDWFSDGCGGNEGSDGPNTESFFWKHSQDVSFARVELDEESIGGFGFQAIQFRISNLADATVYESEQMGLAGNKVDLDHQFPTDTIGNKLEILLINHEDCACGGLSELRIFAKLPTEQESDPSTPGITATPPPTQPLPTPTPLPPTRFIAVGDRPVALSASPVFHYSLEYWQCGGDFKPLNHTAAFTPAQIVAKCKALNPTFQPKKLGEVELLARMGWEVWAGVNEVFGSGRLWIKQDVWISEIVYKGTAATE